MVSRPNRSISPATIYCSLAIPFIISVLGMTVIISQSVLRILLRIQYITR